MLPTPYFMNPGGFSWPPAILTTENHRMPMSRDQFQAELIATPGLDHRVCHQLHACGVAGWNIPEGNGGLLSLFHGKSIYK